MMMMTIDSEYGAKSAKSAAGCSAPAPSVRFVQKGAVLHDPYSDARCLPNLT